MHCSSAMRKPASMTHAVIKLLCCSMCGRPAATWPIHLHATEGLGKVRSVLDGRLLPRDMRHVRKCNTSASPGLHSHCTSQATASPAASEAASEANSKTAT